jgi:hypothetical protein
MDIPAPDSRIWIDKHHPEPLAALENLARTIHTAAAAAERARKEN